MRGVSSSTFALFHDLMQSPAFRSALTEFVEEEKRTKLEYLRDMVRQQSPQATAIGAEIDFLEQLDKHFLKYAAQHATNRI